MRYRLSLILSAAALATGCGVTQGEFPDAEFPAAVAIAPLDEALSFARVQRGESLRLIAVHSFSGDEVTGFDLTKAFEDGTTDPIALYNEQGYDALRNAIQSGFTERLETFAASELTIPIDLRDKHIAAGTNFAAHAEESSVEDGPFLFVKPVAPTAPRSNLSLGDALLDYEVELAFVTLLDLPLPDRPERFGLILTNDFSDRALLMRNLNVDDVTSGDGFSMGKGGIGYLPVGNLFVIPRDLDAFVRDTELKLSVNGELRQRDSMQLAIWDIDEILRQVDARRDTTWEHHGDQVALPIESGAIPARTLILAGTPEGVTFQGVPSGIMARGAIRYAAGGWGDGLVPSVIESYINDAAKKKIFLQEGDTVDVHVERLGTIHTTIAE